MVNNIVQIDTVVECLTERCSDCTGFYVNRLFNHRLQCLHGCHKIKEKVLEEVGSPESNTIPRTSASMNCEDNEDDG